MRVMVVGGSGYVASLVLPILAQQHTLRVFDRRPPASAEWEYLAGDVNDASALAQAAEGMHALLYMAMGTQNWESAESISTAFDTSTKGLYLALYSAQHAGVTHAVYTSSMSVYENLMGRYFADEEIVPDARDHYGFTKYLGEEVCRNAARLWGMTVNILRLCHPRSNAQWQSEAHEDRPTIATAADDLARALLAALEYRGGGCEAFMISGDYQQKWMNMSKARRLLQWEPLARPTP